MAEDCPFYGLDPYEYVDVGIGSTPVAVACCEEGVRLLVKGESDLAKARMWAPVIAGGHQRPAYIYRRADGRIVITLAQRERSWEDDVPLALLETVQP